MLATVGAGLLLGVASSLINGLLRKVAGVVPSISLRAVLKMVSKSFELKELQKGQDLSVPDWRDSIMADILRCEVSVSSKLV